MIDPSTVQTVTLTGQRFVILPEADYLRLLGESAEPELPAPDNKGRYPAVEAARVILARKLRVPATSGGSPIRVAINFSTAAKWCDAIRNPD